MLCGWEKFRKAPLGVSLSFPWGLCTQQGVLWAWFDCSAELPSWMWCLQSCRMVCWAFSSLSRGFYSVGVGSLPGCKESQVLNSCPSIYQPTALAGDTVPNSMFCVVPGLLALLSRSPAISLLCCFLNSPPDGFWGNKLCFQSGLFAVRAATHGKHALPHFSSPFKLSLCGTTLQYWVTVWFSTHTTSTKSKKYFLVTDGCNLLMSLSNSGAAPDHFRKYSPSLALSQLALQLWVCCLLCVCSLDLPDSIYPSKPLPIRRVPVWD